jgi:hypothetical protein
MANHASDEVLRKLQKGLALPWVDKDFEGVKADLRAGNLQAFWNDRALVLTEICVSPRRRFLNIYMAAGRMEDVFALQPQMVQFARENGLSECQGLMRPGWAKSLKKRGWVKWHETWHLPFEHWD